MNCEQRVFKIDEYYGFSNGVENIITFLVDYYNTSDVYLIVLIRENYLASININLPDTDVFLVGIATLLVISIPLVIYQKIFSILWEENEEDHSRDYYTEVFNNEDASKQGLNKLKFLAIFPVIVGAFALFFLNMTSNNELLSLVDTFIASSFAILSIYIIHVFNKFSLLKIYLSETAAYSYISKTSSYVTEKAKTMFNNQSN